MKTWAWILGGIGVTAGAWWYLKKRSPETSASSSETIYPEGVIPGVTPGYPEAPSVDELPSDPAQHGAPTMGESYAPSTNQSASQASSVSAGYSGSSANASSSSGAAYAVGDGIATNPRSSTAPLFTVKPYSPPPVVRTPYVRPHLVKAQPKPAPKAIVVAPMMTPKPSSMVVPKAAPMTVDSMAAPRSIVSSPSPVMIPAPVVASRPETAPVSTPTSSYVTSLLRPVAAPTAPIAPALQPPKVVLPGDVQTTAPLPSPMVSLPRPVAPMPSPVVAPKPIVSSPRPVVAPQPTKVTVTTYKSPVTSATRTVVAPVVVAPRVVAAPKPVSPAPLARTPLTRPIAVVRPTNVRGVYAVGADFTEAEYRAMAARAEHESRRREWAANQMAEQMVRR